VPGQGGLDPGRVGRVEAGGLRDSERAGGGVGGADNSEWDR
jgi:hypothetical protein